MNDLSADSLKLDSQLCFKLYAASRAVIRGYKPMLDQLGLTYPQYLAMLVLWEWQETAPEQPTVKALGERLALDSGTLTPLLKRLEQLQLVQRQRSARDEREVHLSLTHEGLALRDQVGPLKARLLCDSGVDLGRLEELRTGLDYLLGQIKAAS
ncbi:MarR family transcriptional regulator [Pseudomonas sp. B2M1-30]|uniref:MarR family transcriptional regulator n=1 Tax=Pseudomonas koreensis TaxID=198620 RepID=A0A9X2XGN2_9PSED|nr:MULTISPECIES: MarR family transcriptional regulator [Pseudomonas]MBV4474402.1 MarR family transcriptional regulator [Pseudomonas botevensis]MCU0119233.1 MarR family transcriptional regulator [Pseudomonas sp. B2M1-30]MCU7248635.1 MarR family transcriptional regulator [Pseudomonas koreensis]MCU7261554.1 MarR family transcriptional regulator [Pseudomonas koreensis]